MRTRSHRLLAILAVTLAVGALPAGDEAATKATRQKLLKLTQEAKLEPDAVEYLNQVAAADQDWAAQHQAGIALALAYERLVTDLVENGPGAFNLAGGPNKLGARRVDRELIVNGWRPKQWEYEQGDQIYIEAVHRDGLDIVGYRYNRDARILPIGGGTVTLKDVIACGIFHLLALEAARAKGLDEQELNRMRAYHMFYVRPGQARQYLRRFPDDVTATFLIHELDTLDGKK